MQPVLQTEIRFASAKHWRRNERLLQRQINWFAPSLYFFNSKRGERLSTHTSLERVLRHSSLMSARRRKLPCDHLNTPPLRKRPLLTTP